MSEWRKKVMCVELVVRLGVLTLTYRMWLLPYNRGTMQACGMEVFLTTLRPALICNRWRSKYISGPLDSMMVFCCASQWEDSPVTQGIPLKHLWPIPCYVSFFHNEFTSPERCSASFHQRVDYSLCRGMQGTSTNRGRL